MKFSSLNDKFKIKNSSKLERKSNDMTMWIPWTLKVFSKSVKWFSLLHLGLKSFFMHLKIVFLCSLKLKNKVLSWNWMNIYFNSKP